MQRALSRKNLWEQLPPALKVAAGRVLGWVPPEYLIGRRFRRELAFLRQAQWWPPDRARRYQLDQLQRICRIAAHTPFYRGWFSQARFNPDAFDIGDLQRLPRLDRDTLRANLERMCGAPPDRRHVDYVTTGGTSGKPLRFYINASRSPVEFAYLVASWERAGYILGTPLAVFRGRAVRRQPSGLRHEHDRALRHHFYSSFHLCDDDVARVLEHVQGIGPCFLHVYPSTVTTLARYIERHRLEAPANILGILAESEILYPEQQALAERVFRRRVFASYGLTEKVAAAAPCERSDHYHVWPTYGYVELLDEQGVPVTTPGARGEITATGFMNTIVPFIRYRTGDEATYVADRCDACGRAHLVLADIRGHRVQEMLVAADGSEISWTAVNMHDDTFDRVVRFQFQQDEPGRALLKIVPAADFGPLDAARIQQRLAQKMDRQLVITLQTVDEIALSSSGKAIYVDQRIPVPARGLIA